MKMPNRSSPYKNPFIRWINDRLPIISFFDHALNGYQVPKNLSILWTGGVIAGFILVSMIVSGIFLAMHYVPHPDHAFDSVERIMRDVNFGWLIRYIHANGASMFFIIVYLHMFRGLYYGSYKSPRELLWIIGVLIFLIMMATAFLGYVLPWGQMSYWGATVITNLFTAIPWIGDSILEWLLGASYVGAPALNKFFTLHYLLPFIIFAFTLLHIWALHTNGSNNPTGIEPKNSEDTIPFHPYYTVKDCVSIGGFMVFFSFFIFFSPNFFGEPENYIPADPMVTPAHIVPEWYFLPFYAILRAVPDKLGGFLAMIGSIFVLFILPWLDNAKTRSATFRPIFRALFWVFVIDVLILGWVGSKPPEGTYIIIGRLATAYYFIHFLILVPLVSRFEKPVGLPETLSEYYRRR
jgi:ubiquinol-cytochrome c reductase cytochrome b subunit